MKLTWAPLAVEDRDSIFSYIAADNPSAAIDLDELIEQKAALLIEQPQVGHMGRVAGTRQFVVHPHYVLVYDVAGSRIRILRVLHTSLQYPPRKRPTKPRRQK